MRTILKLARSLETEIAPIEHPYQFISFNPEQHGQAWLDLNNAIFKVHPDQGNWALADLENRMRESWFDAQGFLLCLKDDEIIGFCWTKIHHDFVNVAPFGELYVIGVHPDYSGQGIGKAICVEGLIYLRNKGLTSAILYVDEDNEAGKGLYKSLGFN